MPADEKIKNLEKELARVRRELSSYRLAAARVGDHLTEIAELNQELDRSRNEINLILDTTSDAMRLVSK